jgi:hypothetical protein
MLHLPIERIAEIVDGGTSLDEREHLAVCARCARELGAYRAIVAMATDERRRIAPPLTSWESLGARLRDEGLVAGRYNARNGWHWMRRGAAAALLLVGGALAGRLSSGLSVADTFGARLFFARTPADSLDDVALVANGESNLRSAQEALAQLRQAQRAYEEAAAFLAVHDTSSATGATEQYRTRLAALDQASETFQEALTDAPRDPVLNQYFLATMNAREATMRRLGTTLPVTTRLGRF